MAIISVHVVVWQYRDAGETFGYSEGYHMAMLCW